MNVQIQSVKFDADKRLVEFVNAKMAKLDRFAERSTGAEVILKLDKDHEKGNKFATITLHMPGEDLVACHQSKAFEESFGSPTLRRFPSASRSISPSTSKTARVRVLSLPALERTSWPFTKSIRVPPSRRSGLRRRQL